MTIMASPGLNRAASAMTRGSKRQPRLSPASDFMTMALSALSMLASFP